MDFAFIFIVQEDAGPVRQHPDGEAGSILAQDRTGGDERFFGEIQEPGDAADFSIGGLDLPFPAAAGAAADAGDDDFGGWFGGRCHISKSVYPG